MSLINNIKTTDISGLTAISRFYEFASNTTQWG